MSGIAEHYGVIGVLVVNETVDCGGIVYLRYDPAARETTKWDDSSVAAFNDALAAVVATVKQELPVRECRFYSIDWQQATTNTNIKFEGRSLTLAAALAICSYHGKFPLGHVLCTGDLSQDGRVLPVDPQGLEKKLLFVNEIVASPFKVLLIPAGMEKLPMEPPHLKIHQVETLEQALKEVGPQDAPIRFADPTALSADPTAAHQKSLIDMARVALTGGDFAEAIRIYDKILEQDSRNAEVWFQKGMALLKLLGKDCETAEAVLSVAAHLSGKNSRPAGREVRQQIVSKAGACLSESIKINPGCRTDLAQTVSLAWERLTGEYVPRLQESLKLAGAPEDIRTLEQIVMNINKIILALRQQTKWITSPGLMERLQRDWEEIKHKAEMRLKTLREIESEINIALSINRLSKSVSGDGSDLPPNLWLYGWIFIFSCCIIFATVNSGIHMFSSILGLLIALSGLIYLQSKAADRSPAEPPDTSSLWMNYGKKRGIDFAMAPSGGPISKLNDMSNHLSKVFTTWPP